MCAFVPPVLFVRAFSPFVHVCVKDFLCVSVFIRAAMRRVCVLQCVFSERNLCYLLWTQFIMEHWNQSPSRPFGKWRAPPASYDYTALPPGPDDPVLTNGKECDWSRLAPKLSIQFIFSPFQLQLCASLLKYSAERHKKNSLVEKRIPFARQRRIRRRVCHRRTLLLPGFTVKWSAFSVGGIELHARPWTQWIII